MGSFLPICLLLLALVSAGSSAPGDPIDPPADATHAENAADQTLTVTRAVTTDPVTITITATGTATAGDYSIFPASLFFAAGTASADFLFRITDDTDKEVAETVILTFRDGTNTATTTLTIEESDTVGYTITSPLTFPENVGLANIAYDCIVSSDLASVDFSLAAVDGLAQVTADYAFTPQTVTCTNGQSLGTVIVITDDTVPEKTETVSLAVSSTTPAFAQNTEFSITDNDPIAITMALPATAAEGGSALTMTGTTFAFTNGDHNLEVPITVQVTSGTATVGADVTTSETFNFLEFNFNPTSPNLASLNAFTISITEDSDAEAAETFTVSFTSDYVLSGDTTKIITIDDNDPETVTLASDPAGTVMVAETAGSANYKFTRTSGARAISITVVVTSDDTTSANVVTKAGDTVTFAVGVTEQTYSVTINDDGDLEAAETYTISASGPLVSPITPLTVAITEDDGYGISTSDVTVVEGTNAVVTFTRDSTVGTLVLDAMRLDRSAVAPGDYNRVTGGTITFPPGTASQTLSTTTVDDSDHEDTETFVVTVSSTSTLKPSSTLISTVSLTDNDVEVLMLTGPGNVAEDSGPAAFTLTRTASFQALTVNVAVAGSGARAATAVTDFTAPPATATFPIGSDSITINVPIVDDGTIEYSEELTMTVTASGGIVTVTDTATITNDDPYTITATSDSPVTEGSPATITITRDSGIDSLTLAFTTADGSAVSPTDYADGAGSVTFADGETTKTITISVVDDSTYEAQESFTWKVTAAPLVTGSALNPLTINIDDNEPETITISGSQSVNEDGTSAVYTFTRDNTDRATTISYEVVPNAILLGESHNVQAIPATNLAFAVGDDEQTITVNLIDDSMKETAKGFEIRATGTLVTINQPYVVSIVDDDGYLVTFSDETITEGGNKVITFTRDSTVDSFTINVASASGTATSGTDFTAVNSDETFAPGSNTVTVTVATTADTVHEADETFTLTVTSTGILKGTPPFTQTITITDDDTEVLTLSVAGGGTIDEDSGPAVFTLTRTASFATLSVDLTTAGLGANQATSGSDYTEPTSPVVFAIGSTSETINLAITSDSTVEHDEGLTLTATGPGPITPVSQALTITNDDPYTVTVTVAAVDEGNDASVTFTRDSGIGALTIAFSTTDGTATGGSDFPPQTAQTVAFVDGVTVMVHTIAATDDADHEGPETYTVTILANPSLTPASFTPVTVTINDNDPEVLTITEGATVSVNENAGPATFTLTRTASFESITASVTTAPSGTYPVANDDYTALIAQSVVFAIGETSKTVTITIADNNVAEPDETFTATVTAPSIATVTTEVTIVNEDPDVVTITQFLAAPENGENTDVIIYRTVSDKQVTVKVNTGAVSAVAGSDYTTLSDHEVTFLVGSLEATFVVAITDDASDEDDETFTLQVSGDTVVTSPLYTFIIADNEGGRPFHCNRPGQDCPQPTDICHPELPFCQCVGPPGREGEMCNVITGQMSGAACAGKDCNNNGVCLDNAGVTSCACNPGYYGDDCEYYFLQAICTATDMTFIADPVGTFTGRIYVKDKHDVPACTANPLPSPPSNLAGVTDDNTRGFYMVVPHNSADCGPISPIEGVTKTYYERHMFIQYSPDITVGIDQRVTVACQFDRNNHTVTNGIITVDPSGPYIEEATIGDFDPLNVNIDINDIPITPGSQIAMSKKMCFALNIPADFGGLEIIDILFHNNKAAPLDKSLLVYENKCPKTEANFVMAQLPRYSTQVSKRTVEFCFYVFKFVDSVELRVQTKVKICVNAADCDQAQVCPPASGRRKRQADTNTQTVNATFNVVENDAQAATQTFVPTNRTVVSSPLECTTPLSFVPTVISMGVVIFLLILICIYLTYRLSRRSAKKAQREVETTMPQHPVMFMR